VHADLGLALVKQAWSARSDLRILVMSATLDPAPVSRFLNGCPIIEVPGTLHPLAIEYAPGEPVAQAVTTLMSRSNGNILCFLPGAREIADAIAGCATAARNAGFDLVPLHGSLENTAQDQALSPAADRRTVIVATNVAETSLTVPGVSIVIDTGLQKVARYDADRGVDSLTTERVTLDSADQRAGRAARLGPGIVRRLWDERDRLRPHREAEIHRVDLSGPLLAILSWGADPQTFEWFDRPAADRIASAMSLLERLGAVAGGQVTAIGRQMQRLPLHPRLARVVIAAGGSFEGCAAATLLSEPVSFEGTRPSTSCDLLPMLDRWSRVPPHIRRSCESLEQIARSLLGDAYRSHVDESPLRRALLAGYPDRVARRREGDRVTLATGHGAIVGRESGVHDGEWLVALDVTSGRTSLRLRSGQAAATQAIVRMASRIEPEWLAPTRSELHHEIDPVSGSVKAIERDWYDDVILKEHPVAPADDARTRLLAAGWIERGPDEPSARLLRRITFTGAAVDVAALVATTAASARRIDDITLTEDQLPWDLRQKLNAAAPDRLTVPSGREMTIDYRDDGSVSISVKLQELFGLGDTPRLGPNRTPITFNLLAPNGRPVQTTQDLKSFWERTYPEVRKELRGRYPRHPWPEDPWNAPATHRTKKRS
jgi:ATP-dependent helicase HrpB